jgi:hypothetical protein
VKKTQDNRPLKKSKTLFVHGNRAQLHQSKPPNSKPPMVQEAHHTEIAFSTISDQKFLNGILNFKGERRIIS